ncbi:hypothetical protein BH20ACT6_BH20ACT6_01240 [soil metagenome]
MPSTKPYASSAPELTALTGSGLNLAPDDGAAPLARTVADQLGDRVGLVGALGELDRQAGAADVPGADSETTGVGWDAADAGDRNWWPQGLTTSADAAAVPRGGAPPGRRILLSAWYAKQPEHSGAATRVSIVDLDAGPPGPRYAHAVLVAPHRDNPIHSRPVKVHAGGLAWCGERLLVADTRRGVRVFDLGDLVRLPTGTRRWRGFRFVLPQCGWWRAGAHGDTRPLRWSFISLDTTEAGALSLVAGEYARDGDDARLARFALDPYTGQPLQPAPVEVVRTELASMQGAVRVHGTYVVSTSRGPCRRGRLWTGSPGLGPWTRHERALPVGPEDLSYEPLHRRLWTQTEYPGRRYVLSRPLPPGVRPGARR